MTLYLENHKDSIRKLLEWITELSKVAGYKINTQKSPAFLYTNNEKSEREIKESVPFTVATKRIIYLGVNLPKETKELYTENYKTLVKEIKDDINRWGDRPCSWVGRINILKMTILPNALYRFNVISTKLPMAFFKEQEQKFHNSYGNTKDPQIAKAISSKKNVAGAIRPPDFGLYCKTTVMKTVWYWHKKKTEIYISGIGQKAQT